MFPTSNKFSKSKIILHINNNVSKFYSDFSKLCFQVNKKCENTEKSHHQFEKAKTVAYKRNGFSNGRPLSTVEDSTAGKFETKKNFRSYSVHEKEINADFNDDLQAAIVSHIHDSSSWLILFLVL